MKQYKNTIFDYINIGFLILIAFITLYPFWNTIAISFNEATDTLRGGVTFAPREFTLYNYKTLFQTDAIPRAFVVSVARTVINVFTSVFLNAMLAYGLSRREFVLRKPFTFILILSMYINAGLIPTFLLIKNLGMVNSFAVYVIPGMINAFNFIVMRTYMKTVPDSIIESAKMDGYGDFYIFIRIILPLCLPVLATIALFVAVGSWNSWFDTMIYNAPNTNLHTLQYKLMEYLQASQSQSRSASAASTMGMQMATQSIVTPVSIRAAITIIAAAPILFIYPFMQRYFVIGLNVGGVKE